MSPPKVLGGESSCGRVIGPSLDKIIKNTAWRKHSSVVAACKVALDKLETIPASPTKTDPSSPLVGFSVADAHFVLHALVVALDAASGKIAVPALDCIFHLFSLNLVHAEIAEVSDPIAITPILRLIHGACKSIEMAEDAVDVAALRVLLAVVRSPCVLIRGDCLVNIMKSCYNVYLRGHSGTNKICAKTVLAQMMAIVFARVEADSLDVKFKTVSVAELLEFADKNLSDGNSVSFCQNFVRDVIDANDGSAENKNLCLISVSKDQNGDGGFEEDENGVMSDGELDDGFGGGSKIREDGFLVFKNLCKLSMKFSSQEQSDDQMLLRGKTLSLELLKVVMDIGGPIWRTNERQVKKL